MSWILLSVASALLLGCYDLARKRALRDNAVLPVLFLSVLAGALVWAPLLLWARLLPASSPFEEPQDLWLTAGGHALVFAKAALVALSWIFGYLAIKHLPLSIAAPIRSTSPLWTILIAVVWMGEQPTPGQWAGLLIVLGAFYAFSWVGRLEGIHFHRDKWVACMIAATLIGACSSIYDKYLLQHMRIAPATLQAWFSIHLVLVLLPFQWVAWRGIVLRWTWAIPLVGVLLLASDYLYFTAVAQPDALISVISPLRRASVIIPFLGGILLHQEKNFRLKLLCVLGLLAGVVVIQWLG